MKIAVITMFRNEESVALAWRSHVDALADIVLAADHRSSDATHQILSGSSRIAVLNCDSDGHPQSEVMTTLMNACFAAGADWVIPLDMDEFMPFEHRSQLVEFLQQYEKYDAIKWHWRNIVPRKLDSEFDLDTEFTYRHARSQFVKVLINKRSVIKVPNMIISQGSHGLEGGKLRIAEVRSPILLHIPVRSLQDFQSKLVKGTAALDEAPHLKERGYGSHWGVLLTQLNAGPKDDALYYRQGWCYPSSRCRRLHRGTKKETFGFRYSRQADETDLEAVHKLRGGELLNTSEGFVISPRG
jgi:Glycosyl transferase family 2